MPDDPILAVIVPCYNYQTFVGKAIESVLSQITDEVQLLVVDDQSTDHSWAVIKSYGVTAIQVTNGGPRKACLAALQMTKASFILCLDADDELRPGALKTIIGHLDPSIAKLQFCLTCIDEKGAVLSDRYPRLSEYRAREALQIEILCSGVYQSPPTSGNVFRRDVFEILQQCDYDRFVDGVTLFIAPFMGDVVSLASPLGSYRIHSQNHSGVGRLPSAEDLQRDLERFKLRSEHLTSLLEAYKPNGVLQPYWKSYYFLSIKLSLATVSSEPFSLTDFVSMFFALMRERRSKQWKIASAVYNFMLFFAPKLLAKHLLAARLDRNRKGLLSYARNL